MKIEKAASHEAAFFRGTGKGGEGGAMRHSDE